MLKRALIGASLVLLLLPVTAGADGGGWWPHQIRKINKLMDRLSTGQETLSSSSYCLDADNNQIRIAVSYWQNIDGKLYASADRKFHKGHKPGWDHKPDWAVVALDDSGNVTDNYQIQGPWSHNSENCADSARPGHPGTPDPQGYGSNAQSSDGSGNPPSDTSGNGSDNPPADTTGNGQDNPPNPPFTTNGQGPGNEPGCQNHKHPWC